MSSSDLKFRGYAVKSADSWDNFEVVNFKPKELGDMDVEIKISHCGVCGSDVSTAQAGWGPTAYPIIVGHEIVGRVTRVGAGVKTFKVGDRAGIGAQVFACLKCRACKSGNENYCSESMVHTYNDKYANGDVAHGGYATGIRAHEQFVFHIPDALDDEIAAPMLCGGITVYSPLKNGGCKPGARVGVVGIGGLGHFAILFASAMGAEVTAISHNDKKKADAEKMGASKFIIADDAGEWAKEYKGYFDIIISTRNDASMPVAHFLSTLGVRGHLISVGLPHAPWTGIHAFSLALNGSSLSGSHLGSKTEVEEMLQLAADKNIKTWIQVLPMSKATEAFKAIESGSVRYRTVLKCDLHEESA